MIELRRYTPSTLVTSLTELRVIDTFFSVQVPDVSCLMNTRDRYYIKIAGSAAHATSTRTRTSVDTSRISHVATRDRDPNKLAGTRTTTRHKSQDCPRAPKNRVRNARQLTGGDGGHARAHTPSPTAHVHVELPPQQSMNMTRTIARSQRQTTHTNTRTRTRTHTHAHAHEHEPCALPPRAPRADGPTRHRQLCPMRS